jgi:hypothetical protein
MLNMYNSPRRHQPKSNFINDLYYSCSAEFWLSIVTIGIAADWIFKFGAESLFFTGFWAGILAIYGVYSNRTCASAWRKISNFKIENHLRWLLVSSVLLTTFFGIFCMTDPAHALIITPSGEPTIKKLLDGSLLTSAGAPSTAMAGFADLVVKAIKVFFALVFIFSLYAAYEKYRERAELQEIIQAPVVLVIVVLAIDGILGLIFGAGG